MTESQLIQIEAALGITLPTAYRELVVPFPVPADVGNSGSELWDEPGRLVELNRDLRTGMDLFPPWPTHLFAVGMDGSGCATAIDLRTPACAVWWVDRCQLDAVGSGEVSPSLVEWSKQYLADLRSELESSGIDPDGPPGARESAEDESARAGCREIIILVGVLALVVLAVVSLIVWFIR